MRIVVISLERASDRRARVAREFAAVGLPYEIKSAIDGRLLSEDHLSQVDWHTQQRLGLPPPADGAIALWLTQQEVLRDLVENGPEMMAIFEDDARLEPGLPGVLHALEQKRFDFDVVALNRKHPKRRFLPCAPLTGEHVAGRVRFSDSGGYGYVITRAAAGRLLETMPKMVWPVDHAVLRFWVNCLNVFYVDPAVVHHAPKLPGGGYEDSFIGHDRTVSSRLRPEARYRVGFWRGAVAGIRRGVRKYVAFRKLLRDDRRNMSLPLAERRWK